MKNSISVHVNRNPTSASNWGHNQRNIYETLKKKLGIGARLIQGVEANKIFRQMFGVAEEERLLKASSCHLSTTAGPIAGFLFISTEKIAFCSKRSLRLTSSFGDVIETPYKVIIPLKKIKRACESENMNKPSQKYLEIFTVDNFDFWFMGFVDYQKTVKYIQQAISQF